MTQSASKKPPAKKTPGKKGATQAKGLDVPALGKALDDALKATGAWRPKSIDGVKATVANLKKGQTPTNAALAKLRDTINETSAAAREHDEPKVAKSLSALNRLVRRLERATR